MSPHEIKIVLAMQKNKGWMTANDLAEITGVTPRTARSHCSKLVKIGVLNREKLFPAHRYQWSPLAEKNNEQYVKTVAEAAEVLAQSAYKKS